MREVARKLASKANDDESKGEVFFYTFKLETSFQ